MVFISFVSRQTRSQVALHGNSLATRGVSQYTRKVGFPTAVATRLSTLPEWI